MTTFDLYGYQPNGTHDIQAALLDVERALGVEFIAYESSYQGGEYFRFGNSTEEHFLLKWNVDPFDGEPVEPSFAEYGIILYINDTVRSTDIRHRIEQGAEKFVLLRHENFE